VPPGGEPRPRGAEPPRPPAGPRPPAAPRVEPPAAGPARTEQHRAEPQRAEPHRTEPHRPEPAGQGGRQPGEAPRFASVSELPDDTRRLRLTALAGLVLVLLVALPLFLLIRDSAKDPVTANLDSLNVPSWAAVGHEDATSGSRWCVKTCRWRERTWRSDKASRDTDPAYRSALSAAGWTTLTTGCPAAPGTGSYSCWQREQYRLDLWTRDAVCGLSGVAPSPGATLPAATPSAGPNDLPLPVPSASGPPPTCQGALVTAKVAARLDPHWTSP
jgi:hypothetical protein